MANVTLSLDDELLSKSREFAAAQGTSLNALLRKILSDLTVQSDPAVEAMMELLEQTEGCSDGRKIDRADLHRY